MKDFKVALVDMNADAVPDWVSDGLAHESIDLVAAECTTREELLGFAGDAEVVWLKADNRIVTTESLPDLRQCGAILRTGSGTDNVPVEEATRLGIVVAHTPEAYNDEVSDHAIALLLAVVRQIAANDRALRSGIWHREHAVPRWHLVGQTLGLVGFGHIGSLVVKKMSGFDMTVLAHDPYVDAETLAAAGAHPAPLEEVLSKSDFVSLHCPLTKDTRHLIGERELRLMKPGAVLINTSRGPVVDEAALVRALTEGWIAAAGLDVFDQEPTPADNPLLKLDNVVATPHMAGYSDQHGDAAWRLSMEAVIDLSKGRWPRRYVNRDVKPRMKLS